VGEALGVLVHRLDRRCWAVAGAQAETLLVAVDMVMRRAGYRATRCTRSIAARKALGEQG
jgi:hypothetical protein